MVEKDYIRVGYKFDQDTIDGISELRAYLDNKYGIHTDTGTIKYLVKKGQELAKENKL